MVYKKDMSGSGVSSIGIMQTVKEMYVIKRDGRRQNIDFNKITDRLFRLCKGLNNNHIHLFDIVQKVVAGLKEGMETRDLDNLAAEICANMNTLHPDYGVLAARIEVSNTHKETKEKFSDVVHDLYYAVDDKTGESVPVVSKEFYEDVMANKDTFDAAIDYERDYDFTYFGLKTIQKSYLLKVNGRIAERPQHMLMRVAVALHKDDVQSAIDTYESMSKRFFIHASPTLFNAGTNRAGLASCYLMCAEEDSIPGIFELVKECAMISAYSGGIGLNIHDIRAKGSKIRSSNGVSEGIVPMMRVFNDTALYVTQSSKRPGSIAVFLEPTHPEIMDFLEMKLPTGVEKMRARDLFYAMWIPDLFMEKVQRDEEWCFFCPNEAPGLSDVYGDEYVALYEKYEREGLYRKKVPAQKVWEAIINSQVETGVPYMCYKDAINLKANQKHIGTIKSSNLCTEITIRSSNDEIGVCILASMGLPAFVREGVSGKEFDHELLYEKTKLVTRNLNKVIDRSKYPVEKARVSNERHRPIGIGVSGLADTFCMLRLPFDSNEAKVLNRQIFETIYYAALEASCELSERDGPYPSYEGSEFSKGRLQFDMWKNVQHSGRWDWDNLKDRIAKFGLRNSLLTAVMPTATTSQILGYSECIEPYNSNIYLRKTLSGEFQVVNQHLFKELCELGIWSEEVKRQMIQDNGSIQNIKGIPGNVKELYKTVWEIKQRHIIDMAADRGPYVDQTQSMNLFFKSPMYDQLCSVHFYGWQKGLKTGMYYLKMQPPAEALKITVGDQSNEVKENGTVGAVCQLGAGDCTSCSA